MRLNTCSNCHEMPVLSVSDDADFAVKISHRQETCPGNYWFTGYGATYSEVGSAWNEHSVRISRGRVG